jgi:hypothetical protein
VKTVASVGMRNKDALTVNDAAWIVAPTGAGESGTTTVRNSSAEIIPSFPDVTTAPPDVGAPPVSTQPNEAT